MRVGLGVTPPDLVTDRPIVGVDAVGAEIAVTREMELNDAVGGDGGQVRLGVPSVVEAADGEVVHVEQQAAVGRLGEAREEGAQPVQHRLVRL